MFLHDEYTAVAVFILFVKYIFVLFILRAFTAIDEIFTVDFPQLGVLALIPFACPLGW